MVDLVANLTQVYGGNWPIKHQFSELFQLFNCNFLQKFIRVIDQCIATFIIFQKFLDYFFFSVEKFAIEKYLIGVDGFCVL